MKRTKKENKAPTVLTCDPSLTAWGYVVVKGYVVLATGCIKTSPENKKRRIRKGDDNVRRISEIIHELKTVIFAYKVNYITTELPHGSQNASGAIMIGVVMGIMETISHFHGIPVEWYSENDAKKCALPGQKVVSKSDMIEAMNNEFIVEWPTAKYIKEAVADSLAIYYCALHSSPTLQYLQNL
jgi:Holliday junction resolvasome RuvABC endonuclease subunit